ncbi:MAG TPA: YkgJ family cysteine cluster protein [Dissulfurispiraceae bacterium]|nr:YkgJ family cysteine cluster protein [Dissulfurispiraceae bacterium]
MNKHLLPKKRIAFPDDEQLQPWLSLLFTAYAVIDEGVRIAIGREEKKRGARLACRKGCSTCCRTHRDIPAYPIELVGISWYVIEKMSQPLRRTIRQHLLQHGKGGACPFLVDDACAIHLVRPIACRQFNVFNTECKDSEDPFYTRRQDVLTPVAEHTDTALEVTLPFYGIAGEAARKRAIESRLINALIKVLQECPWSDLARRMDDFDFSRQ